MKTLFTFFLLFTTQYVVSAQTKDQLQKYISKELSYKSIAYKSGNVDSKITVYEISFKDCTMSYKIFKKTGDKIERYTVRILLSRISGITMGKGKSGYYLLSFATNGKSILKEYGDGNLIHEKVQSIPLTGANSKALEYFKKLNQICTKGNDR